MNLEDKYQACVHELKEYIGRAGFSDVVIGLSGGIDSALTSIMCVDAFGASHVHGVLMPGPYSSAHSIEDAEALAHNCGIETYTIPIMKPYEAFKEVFDKEQPEVFDGLAAENTQARCRMICLMALSNAYGWAVINTGNKTEGMLGYSTLYGDSIGMFAPLGGIYKTTVYELAEWRNGKEAAKRWNHRLKSDDIVPIPLRSITKPPSAELAPGQEDEKALGLSYEIIDKLLVAYIEKGKRRETLISEGYSPKDIDWLITRIEASAFKRDLEPPVPRAEFY